MGQLDLVCGKDVATVLRYKNPQEAVREHVDDEDKGGSKILPPWRKAEYDSNQ